MSFFASPVTVTIVRSDGLDDWGNPQPEERISLPGCHVSPVMSEDEAPRTEVTVSEGWLRWDSSIGVRKTDQIIVPDGHPMAGTWDVIAAPAGWQSPFTGWQPPRRARIREAA